MEALCNQLEGMIEEGVSTDNLVDTAQAMRNKQQHQQPLQQSQQQSSSTTITNAPQQTPPQRRKQVSITQMSPTIDPFVPSFHITSPILEASASQGASTPSRRFADAEEGQDSKRARLANPKQSTLTLILQTNQQILAEVQKLVKQNRE